MRKYLIGIILQLLILLLMFFVEPIKTINFEYGRINGVGSVYKEGAVNTYNLYELYGTYYIFIAIFLIFVLIFYLIILLKKCTNIIPGFILNIISFVPMILMICAKIIVSREAKYVGNSIAVYGSGIDGSINGIGWLLIVMMGASCFLLLIGVGEVEHEIMQKGEKSIKKINVIKKKDINENEFKM